MTGAYVVSAATATLIVTYSSGSIGQLRSWGLLWGRLLSGSAAPVTATSGATLTLVGANSGSTPKNGA
jgi:hypothetical protein